MKYAGAADWIIDRAGAYKCDVCQAMSMRNSTPVASTENPSPLDAISVDGFEWTPPVTRSRSRCTLIIDEGSLKASGRVHETSAENEKTYSNTRPQEAWHTLMAEWFKPYGKPLRIRSDPEGSYRSAMLQQNALDHDIVWETTASQAQWMTGMERVIGLIKHTMSKMASEDPSLSHDDLFTWSVVAHNELMRDDVWSLDQTIIGRQSRPLDHTINPSGFLQSKSASMRGHSA